MANETNYEQRREALKERYLGDTTPDEGSMLTGGVDHLVLISADLELAHGGGFGFAMASVFNGGTLELLAAFDPAKVMARLASGDVTSAFMVPTHVHQILSLPEDLLRQRSGFRASLAFPVDRQQP